MRPSRLGVILRSTLFNVAFYGNTIVLMFTHLRVFGRDRHATLDLARLWARTSLNLLERICGTVVEFRGLEHVRPGVVIAAKHQSFLETFAMTLPIADFSYILKRELIQIPMFGWLLRSAEQVAIDRRSGRTALAQVVEAAGRLRAEGRSIFIFPEGTRRPVDAAPLYKGGIGHIYVDAGATVVPVALNTGLFWPRRSFLRKPGTCVIEFLPPIEPGLDRETFMRVLQERLETETARLVAEARAKQPWLAKHEADQRPAPSEQPGI